MAFVGDNLPQNVEKETIYMSKVTDKPVKGDGYVLEDNVSFLTLEEALLLKETIGFSPLCSGHVLNPF